MAIFKDLFHLKEIIKKNLEVKPTIKIPGSSGSVCKDLCQNSPTKSDCTNLGKKFEHI